MSSCATRCSTSSATWPCSVVPLLGHVIARNAGHALNFDLVVAVQRALGLERRPAGAVLRALPALEPVERAEGFAPGLAAI